MNVAAYEAVVENGQVRLPAGAELPENTKVYVVVPGLAAKGVVRIFSPRLLHPEQVGDFVKEVIQESPDAPV
jgi:hypothetical protein